MKDKAIKILKMIGLGFLEPLLRLNENPKEHLLKFFKMTIIPVLAFIAFLLIWNWGAYSIQNKVEKRKIQEAYKNDVDNYQKQQGKSEDEAKKIARKRAEDTRRTINVNKFKDIVYGDMKPYIDKVVTKRINGINFVNDEGNKKDINYVSKDTYKNMSSQTKGTLTEVKDSGYAYNVKTVYIILDEEDLNTIPDKLKKGTLGSASISLTTSDIEAMFSKNEYSKFYEMEYLPRPSDVLLKWKLLNYEHNETKSSMAAFYENKEKEIAAVKASEVLSKEEKIEKIKELKELEWSGNPTFFDQILTSLLTVLSALILAMFIAVPLGILIGLSPVAKAALNPIIQLVKPISPVVWFLLVAMIVNAVIDTETAMVPKSFTISYIAVALCAMWATLVNTSVGVSSISQDLINVADVLKVKGMLRVFKVILPSAIPLIFTGLRITVTTAWMVLIAVELLAQNPGLGKFVWDEYNNSGPNSNAKILVAAFVIGIIGFLLDRIMMMIQKTVSFDKKNVS